METISKTVNGPIDFFNIPIKAIVKIEDLLPLSIS